MRNLREHPVSDEEQAALLQSLLEHVIKTQGVGSLHGYALRRAIDELHYMRFAREYQHAYGLDGPEFYRDMESEYTTETTRQVPSNLREPD